MGWGVTAGATAGASIGTEQNNIATERTSSEEKKDAELYETKRRQPKLLTSKQVERGE
jgi:hypothetical protein